MNLMLDGAFFGLLIGSAIGLAHPLRAGWRSFWGIWLFVQATLSINWLALCLALMVTACPPPGPPQPMPPDATDAAPLPVDAPAPGGDCQKACEALARLCKPQQPNCATTLEALDRTRLIRMKDGHTLGCADLAAASTPAQVQALGVSCP